MGHGEAHESYLENCNDAFHSTSVLDTDRRPAATLAARGMHAVAHLITRTGMSGGVCAVPECGYGSLAITVANHTELLVHAFDTRPDAYLAALQRRQQAGLDARRVIVERLESDPLPYVDRFVDLLLMGDPTSSASAQEAARVIRPRGWALVRQQQLITCGAGAARFRVVASRLIGNCCASRHWPTRTIGRTGITRPTTTQSPPTR